jgi:hypothetical protein
MMPSLSRRGAWLEGAKREGQSRVPGHPARLHTQLRGAMLIRTLEVLITIFRVLSHLSAHVQT